MSSISGKSEITDKSFNTQDSSNDTQTSTSPSSEIVPIVGVQRFITMPPLPIVSSRLNEVKLYDRRELPASAIERILSFLSTIDILRLSSTCKKNNEIIPQDEAVNQQILRESNFNTDAFYGRTALQRRYCFQSLPVTFNQTPQESQIDRQNCCIQGNFIHTFKEGIYQISNDRGECISKTITTIPQDNFSTFVNEDYVCFWNTNRVVVFENANLVLNQTISRSQDPKTEIHFLNVYRLGTNQIVVVVLIGKQIENFITGEVLVQFGNSTRFKVFKNTVCSQTPDLNKDFDLGLPEFRTILKDEIYHIDGHPELTEAFAFPCDNKNTLILDIGLDDFEGWIKNNDGHTLWHKKMIPFHLKEHFIHLNNAPFWLEGNIMFFAYSQTHCPPINMDHLNAQFKRALARMTGIEEGPVDDADANSISTAPEHINMSWHICGFDLKSPGNTISSFVHYTFDEAIEGIKMSDHKLIITHEKSFRILDFFPQQH